MKSHSRTKPPLQAAITKLQYVARKKRAQSLGNSPDRDSLLQETRQLHEAIRLLRWVRK